MEYLHNSKEVYLQARPFPFNGFGSKRDQKRFDLFPLDIARYPGTNLRLVYELVSSRIPGNQDF